MKLITIILVAISLWVELLYFVINSNWSLAWIIYYVIFGGGTILSLAGIAIEEIRKPKRNKTLRG